MFPRRTTRSARRLARLGVTRRGFLDPERLRGVVGADGSAWDAASYARLFPRTPDPCPVQVSVVGLAARLGRGPALLLVEAPMGEGTTEAALWWAAACQFATSRGLYLALPTQATSNAM